jgi:hypothetical protein
MGFFRWRGGSDSYSVNSMSQQDIRRMSREDLDALNELGRQCREQRKDQQKAVTIPDHAADLTKTTIAPQQLDLL